MQDHRVLLIHDGDWHWHDIEHVLEDHPDVVELEVEDLASSTVKHVEAFNPDIIIGKAAIGGESLAPVITELRTVLDYTGRIYLLVNCEIDLELSSTLAWVGIDGLVPLSDIPHDRVREFLTVLICGQFRIGTIASSNAYLDVLGAEHHWTEDEQQLAFRQIRLLKSWNGSDHNPTLDELAVELGVSLSTVKRDIEIIRDVLGATNRLNLGVEAVKHGLLP